MMPSLTFGRDTESHDKANRSWRRLGAVLPARPRGSMPELHDPSVDLYGARSRDFGDMKARLEFLSALDPQHISGSTDSNRSQLVKSPFVYSATDFVTEERSKFGGSPFEHPSKPAKPSIPNHYPLKTSNERTQPSSPPTALVFNPSRNLDSSHGSERNWRDRDPLKVAISHSSSESSLSRIDPLTPPPIARRRQVGGQRHPFVSEDRLYKRPPPKTTNPPPPPPPVNPTLQTLQTLQRRLPATSSQTSMFDPSRNLDPIMESIMSPSDYLSEFDLSNEMRSMQINDAAVPSSTDEQDLEGQDFSKHKSFASHGTGGKHVCSICDRAPSQPPSISDAAQSSIGLHVVDDISRSSSDFSSHRTDTASISELSQASGETTASSHRRRKRGRRQAGGQRHPIIIDRPPMRPEPPSIDPTPSSQSTKNPKLWVPGGGRHPIHFPSPAEIAQRKPSQRPNLSRADREQQIRALCSTAMIFRKPRPPFDSDSLRSARRGRPAFPFPPSSVSSLSDAEGLGMPRLLPSSPISPQSPPVNAAIDNFHNRQGEDEHDGSSNPPHRGPRIILWTSQRGIQSENT
jgi:hypothetical protein